MGSDTRRGGYQGSHDPGQPAELMQPQTTGAGEWTPVTQREPDPEFLAKMKAFATVSANPGIDEVHELWANDVYEIIVRYTDAGGRGRAGGMHLSIKRYDRDTARDWRHLQSIKNEICGWEREAFELFPAESRLVDQANQTHLWVAPASVQIPVGWPGRVVATEAEARAKMQTILGPGPDKGRQRDWQPGLSTGPNYKRDGRFDA